MSYMYTLKEAKDKWRDFDDVASNIQTLINYLQWPRTLHARVLDKKEHQFASYQKIEKVFIRSPQKR